MSNRKFGIVDIHSGELIWSIPFDSIGKAKLSARNNHFVLSNVGVAEINNVEAISPIQIYNYKKQKWEEER